jgi:serine O-acetyltransferase
MDKLAHIISKNIGLLTGNEISEYNYISDIDGHSLPSMTKLKDIILLVKEIIFTGYYSSTGRNSGTRKYYIGTQMEKLNHLLAEQISSGLNFFFERSIYTNEENDAETLSMAFIKRLPEIKRLLCTDIKAMFDSDPAAKSIGEVIVCYPSIQAMMHYRVAHELRILGIPALPRILTELAHSATGIDIHPGARIGEYFSIDHGTGVVIGETTIIGNHVSLYKGVTLGAKNFVLDESGSPLNVPRHPIIEDNVVLYSNATVLGRITVGHDSIIGANIWLTNSVPPHSRIIQHQ